MPRIGEEDEHERMSGYFDDLAQTQEDGYTKDFHGGGGGGAQQDAVDFTPPDLISALITESGVLTPSAVSEELIKIWF